jgi:hypothetical protein
MARALLTKTMFMVDVPACSLYSSNNYGGYAPTLESNDWEGPVASVKSLK